MNSLEQIPEQVRKDLADTIEDIGSAMGLLREASDEIGAGNLPGAGRCADDATEILSSLETTFSRLTARIAVFVEQTDIEN